VNVGRVGETLSELQPAGVKKFLPSSLGLSVSVHDVGKVSPGYELKYFSDTVVRAYAPDLCGQASFCSLHACIGAAAIDHWLKTDQLDSSVSLAVAAHHGTLDHRCYPQDTAEILGGPAWAEERQKLIAHLSSVFGGTLDGAPTVNPWLLAGLTCVSDWIGSDEQFFPADRPPVENGDPALTARRAVAECGFCRVPLKNGLSFEQIFGFPPRDAQRQFFDHVSRPGLYVLEAPMGIGKTEAALYAAYRLMEQGFHHGLYFALPTRLTSDRIHERVADFLAKTAETPVAPKLAHGTAWLTEYAHGGEGLAPGETWFNPSKRALLYPYAVGTVDQALLSVLNVKHNFVRLFGLAGKVVILDEVHSYDMYTGTLLDELADRLLRIGCTVIVLSATLTGHRRNRLAPALNALTETDGYPLMTGAPTDGPPFAALLPAPESTHVHIRMEAWSNIRIATEAVAAARRGECVVCIANTVAKAQAWYRAVKSTMPDNAFPVGILHARFPMFQREKIEDEWMAKLGKKDEQRPRGCVLIATQIVEQSVDIDADWMISELAPTDMMLQRMGRLWRHVRNERPCPAPEFVIAAQDPSACATLDDIFQSLGKENACVYAPYVLMRTHAVWKPLQTVSLPNDIRALIEATYAERDEDPASVMGQLKKRLAEKCERLRRLACSAKDKNQGFPTMEDNEHAMTRHSDLPTQTVLLLAQPPEARSPGCVHVRLLDDTEWPLVPNVPFFDATRQLHANTVTIAAYLLTDKGRCRNDARWLDRHFFDKPVVLVCGNGGTLSGLDGTETALRYSPEYGIWRNDKPQDSDSLQAPSDTYSEDSVTDFLGNDW
jgi:CRISPR-associated endonuclease/helicase Cas3